MNSLECCTEVVGNNCVSYGAKCLELASERLSENVIIRNEVLYLVLVIHRFIDSVGWYWIGIGVIATSWFLYRRYKGKTEGKT